MAQPVSKYVPSARFTGNVGLKITMLVNNPPRNPPPFSLGENVLFTRDAIRFKPSRSFWFSV
jgi:hypothetical protein